MAAATVSSGQHAATSVILSPRRRTWIARVSLHPVRLSPPPLRTADGHHREERRASWLELFFDLAFAGAVGQLAGAFQEHPGLGTLARFVMLFTPIWWLWVQLSFYADRHESDAAAHRISFLAAILLCVGLAACAPRALSGDTGGFVVAFACLRGLQLLLYARARHHLPATRPLYNCYLICFGAGGALWLSSLAVAGSGRYAFWAAALLTDASGALAMLAPRRQVPLNPAHLADRFQIFVLIVLGESMARLISAAAMRSWSLPLAVVLTAALITLAALWWAWLTAADRQALDSQPAIAGFTALNLPVVAGIAAASAGRPQGGALRRGQRLSASHRHPAVQEDDAASTSRPAGDRPRRDGTGLHGRDRRARLPGPSPDRGARAGTGRRGPRRAPSPDGAAAPGSSRGTWRGHAACWRSAGRFRACPSGVISSVRTPISLKGATMPAVLAPPASTV